jgi:23S rRNA (adenine-N6)-dimethyltransferase
MNDDISISQNFLRSSRLVQNLIQKSKIIDSDTVVEIGAGKGIITQELAKFLANGRLIALELDKKLIDSLSPKLKYYNNVELINIDVLKYDFARLNFDYKIFANIPFNITSEILHKILYPVSHLTEAYLILEYTALAQNNLKKLIIKPIYEIDIIHSFARKDFEPEPSVDIAMYKFTKKEIQDVQNYNIYKDYCTYLSKDRAGEGNWKNIFTSKQLKIFYEKKLLIPYKGIANQQYESLLETYAIFLQYNNSKSYLINGAYDRYFKLLAKNKDIAMSNNAKRWNRKKRFRNYKI